MRPIGGEFEIAPGLLAGAPREAAPFPATGRAALYQILRHVAASRGPGVVAVPDYLCDSVLFAVEAAGFMPRFYPVGDDLRIDRRAAAASLEGAKAALLISYFGLVDMTEDIAFVRGTTPGCAVVKDDAQSFADAAELRGADYAFTSLRKALPVPDGAPITPAIPLDLDDDRASRFAVTKLAGALVKHARHHEHVAEETYLALFSSAERLLDDPSSLRARASWMTDAVLVSIDQAAIAERRRANFRALAAAIAPLGLRPLVPLADDRAPLFLPVRIRDRDAVRRALAAEGIFCPAHWPLPKGHEAGVATARRLYESELSLVIDQRYDGADMQRIASALAGAGATRA